MPHLAQMNLARVLHPLDSAELKEFMDALGEINGLAEQSPGFVWRLTSDDSDDATGLRPYGPDIMVNLSVWESPAALREFTYQTHHLEYLRRRREWFSRDGLDVTMVLWWIPQGHAPTLDEAKERLDHLAEHGASPYAFELRRPFDPPQP